jgi:exopolyphosphatase/guanosine-5'-triphosphate,3'-diphosphate pyrophosphatase
VGLNISFLLPRRVVSLTRGEEFHSLKATAYPRERSQWLSSDIWVDLPEPSMPSTTISLPRKRFGENRDIYGKVSANYYTYMPRFAAVDIGSNSLRMEAAETTPGSAPKLLTSDRQVTRLGDSVFRTGKISAEAIEFVCKLLTGMAQQYRKLDVAGVRAVATSAVRDAANQDEFIAKASAAIGTPVEIISGQEESRLIHLGVQSRWPHPKQKVLLVDVGGGSAEIMDSECGHLLRAVSKPLGAVRLTEIFLKSDPPTERELDRMENYVEEKLAAAIRRIGRRRWDRVIATSGTASAVACAVNGISQEKDDRVDRIRVSTPQIQKLYGDLRVRSLEERRKITGIGPRRAEIIIAGIAPLFRLLRDLQLASLYYSAAGLRDGIIADLAQRGVGSELSELDRDQRQVVETMARRYGVSLPHARQVATLANKLFTSLQPLHSLPLSTGVSARRRTLCQRLPSSQAFILPGRQFRFAGFYQPRARVRRESLPVSP